MSLKMKRKRTLRGGGTKGRKAERDGKEEKKQDLPTLGNMEESRTVPDPTRPLCVSSSVLVFV